MRVRMFLAAMTAWALSLAPMAARTETPTDPAWTRTYYRDSVSTLTGPPSRYVVPIPASATAHGVTYRVSGDRAGRIRRVERLEDGAPVSETRYVYAAGARWPLSAENYNHGELSGRQQYQRNQIGEVTRTDSFDALGRLTSYSVTSFTNNIAVQEDYAADGKLLHNYTFTADANGEIKNYTLRVPGGHRYGEFDLNDRGLTTEIRVFEEGKISYKTVNTYDQNDDLVRADSYDDKNVPYGFIIYKNNRITEKHYNYSNGLKEDIYVQYNEKNWRSKSSIYVNGTLICNITYDRLADGTIRKSVATGPDGTLWAEYPDYDVLEVARNGRVYAQPTLGTIYHTGDWW